jgi:hypothetical protein
MLDVRVGRDGEKTWGMEAGRQNQLVREGSREGLVLNPVVARTRHRQEDLAEDTEGGAPSGMEGQFVRP